VKQRLALSLCILAAVLLAAELAARRLLPDVPSARHISRNPYRFRAWPEFIRGRIDDAPDAGTVVLLTNSQGYAGELDHRKIYPARLEALLSGQAGGGRPRWDVLNWATDGMTSIELMLLAAYLQPREPTFVLAVTGYADYAIEHVDEGLLYCRSDVSRLATRGAVLRRLPGSYILRHIGLEDALTFFMRDRFALVRYREFLWSWLETRYPGSHSILYAPSINYLPWTLKAKPKTKPLRRPKAGAGDPVLTYREGSKRMLDEYLSALALIPGRVIVVTEPIAVSPGDPRRRWHEAFERDVKVLAAEKGLTLWDLDDALPAEDFMTSSHLHNANHVRFAELLKERLARHLSQGGRREHETRSPESGKSLNAL